jgi:hypothetical protein
VDSAIRPKWDVGMVVAAWGVVGKQFPLLYSRRIT